METIKPIRRSANLKPLSRDHHTGLLLCWKIREGLSRNVSTDRIKDYVLFSFEEELAPHFQLEERLVFSLKRPGDEQTGKALEQHANLRNVITMMKSKPETDKADLRRFAELLDDHIRFEERELFPYIEQTADPDSFDYAGRLIHEAHTKQEPKPWNDEFWQKQRV
jgi:hemerythrin-like domain-containing protein